MVSQTKASLTAAPPTHAPTSARARPSHDLHPTHGDLHTTQQTHVRAFIWDQLCLHREYTARPSPLHPICHQTNGYPTLPLAAPAAALALHLPVYFFVPNVTAGPNGPPDVGLAAGCPNEKVCTAAGALNMCTLFPCGTCPQRACTKLLLCAASVAATRAAPSSTSCIPAALVPLGTLSCSTHLSTWAVLVTAPGCLQASSVIRNAASLLQSSLRARLFFGIV